MRCPYNFEFPKILKIYGGLLDNTHYLMDSLKGHQQVPPIGGIKPRPGLGVETFEFTSNGGEGVALLRLIKRRKATFYEVVIISFDFALQGISFFDGQVLLFRYI
jgi:hypothetical protein